MLIDSTKRVFELLMACPNAVISTLSNRLLGLLCSNSKKCIIRNFAPVCRCRLMRRSSVTKKLYKVNQEWIFDEGLHCITPNFHPFRVLSQFSSAPSPIYQSKEFSGQKKTTKIEYLGQETDAKFFQKLPFSLQNDQLNRFPASTLSS